MTMNSLRLPAAAIRASFPSLPAFLGALLGVLLAPNAFAQPLTVTGSLMVGDKPTGHLEDVELVARRWTSGTRFQFELPAGGDGDEKTAVLYGTIDTRQPDTYVAARVCSDVALSSTGKGSDDFAVTMLAYTEAQLVSRSDRGAVIKVPDPTGDTVERERLLPAAALATQCPDTTDAQPPEGTRLACEPFAFHSRPDETSASFEITAVSRITAKAGKDGWQLVVFDDFHGFRWRGFARVPPKCDETGQGGDIENEGHGIGSRCQQALLPRGAMLRASDRKTLLLAVRRDFETQLCSTKQPFEWEIDLWAGTGLATVRGFFDGSPLPPPGPASPQQ
jgi:hypothetical protein